MDYPETLENRKTWTKSNQKQQKNTKMGWNIKITLKGQVLLIKQSSIYLLQNMSV